MSTYPKLLSIRASADAEERSEHNKGRKERGCPNLKYTRVSYDREHLGYVETAVNRGNVWNSWLGRKIILMAKRDHSTHWVSYAEKSAAAQKQVRKVSQCRTVNSRTATTFAKDDKLGLKGRMKENDRGVGRAVHGVGSTSGELHYFDSRLSQENLSQQRVVEITGGGVPLERENVMKPPLKV